MTGEIEQVKRGPGRPAKTEQETEAKKGTSPGWRPSSVLGTLKARPGFKARWVQNDPARIAKMKAEGWIVMKPTDNVGGFESLSESEIVYRDTIGMMLPNDKAEARSEYYRQELKETTKSILSKSDQEFKRAGVQTYAPKGQAGRIVID